MKWTTLTLCLSVLVRGFEMVKSQQTTMTAAECPKDELQRCVLIAEPLLRDPKFVFPATTEDINTVCRRWTTFVDCVKRYIGYCLPEARRSEFNRAVDEAVQTVNQMCTNLSYQTDYLRHATCIKAMASDSSKCSRQLQYLVDQVSAISISNSQICCGHHAFRECMLTATARHCDMGSNGPAVEFATQMFGKALGFLLRQCEHYIPNASDCPGSGGFDPRVVNGPIPLIPPLNNALRPEQRPLDGPILAPVDKPWPQRPLDGPALGPIDKPWPTTDRPDLWSPVTTWFSTWSSQQGRPFTEPWLPNLDNGLETPKQQSLNSGSPKMGLQWTIVSTLFITSLVYQIFRKQFF